jgi:hypothetical protein
MFKTSFYTSLKPNYDVLFVVAAVMSFDKDRSGSIDVWELRQVLEGN